MRDFVICTDHVTLLGELSIRGYDMTGGGTR
jgi:hypothetical protein